MQGYLDAIDPAQFVDVHLGGVWRRIYRARLGLHLRLARLAERFDAGPDAVPVREYLKACGVQGAGTGPEQLLAYALLRALNDWQWQLPWMNEPINPQRKAPPYEYPDRVWAHWMHKLASRYGWTRDQVFELWPEEAAVYMQEIMVAEYDEAEERRALSELSYSYDKQSKTSRFIPLPRPGWMAGREAPKLRRIRKDMLPVGNVIDLEKMAGTVH